VADILIDSCTPCAVTNVHQSTIALLYFIRVCTTGAHATGFETSPSPFYLDVDESFQSCYFDAVDVVRHPLWSRTFTSNELPPGPNFILCLGHRCVYWRLARFGWIMNEDGRTTKIEFLGLGHISTSLAVVTVLRFLPQLKLGFSRYNSNQSLHRVDFQSWLIILLVRLEVAKLHLAMFFGAISLL
jgi:hypothetical protein